MQEIEIYGRVSRDKWKPPHLPPPPINKEEVIEMIITIGDSRYTKHVLSISNVVILQHTHWMVFTVAAIIAWRDTRFKRIAIYAGLLLSW